jgi:hypothetical protein
MHWTRSKIIVAVAATAVVIGGVAQGRHLLAGSSGPSSAGASAGASAAPGVRSGPSSPVAGSPAPPTTDAGPGKTSATGAVADGSPTSATHVASGSSAPTSGATSSLPAVPADAVTPLVVHTATMDVRVGRGRLGSVLTAISVLAGADGGYVDSSSVSGGTARRSPDAGTVTARVLDSDFADATSKVASLGTVEDEQIKGKDVTIEETENAASIVVLQDEVALLEKKLAQATDIGTFLQIQNQLFPVQRQLQELEASQAVLDNSAALATITVHLTAPGVPVVAAAPKPRPGVDAATTAWRYLQHNSLAVLDGLAVAGGWALPVLIPLGLVGLIGLRVTRRRRNAINPA